MNMWMYNPRKQIMRTENSGVVTAIHGLEMTCSKKEVTLISRESYVGNGEYKGEVIFSEKSVDGEFSEENLLNACREGITMAARKGYAPSRFVAFLINRGHIPKVIKLEGKNR